MSWNESTHIRRAVCLLNHPTQHFPCSPQLRFLLRAPQRTAALAGSTSATLSQFTLCAWPSSAAPDFQPSSHPPVFSLNTSSYFLFPHLMLYSNWSAAEHRSPFPHAAWNVISLFCQTSIVPPSLFSGYYLARLHSSFDSISSERECFQPFSLLLSPPLLLFLPFGGVFFLLFFTSASHSLWLSSAMSGSCRLIRLCQVLVEIPFLGGRHKGGLVKCKRSIHIVMGGVMDGLRTFHRTHRLEQN